MTTPDTPALAPATTPDRLLAAARARLRARRLARADRPRRGATRWLLVGLVALVAVLAASHAYLAPRTVGTELALDELLDRGASGSIATAVLLDQDARVAGTLRGGEPYWAAYPRSDAATGALVRDLAAGGASVVVDPQVAKATVRTLATVLLPLVLLADLFALLLAASRGDAAGMGSVTDFGRVGDRRAEGTGIRGFADVAGADGAVVELREVVEHLRDPSRFDAVGARPPKGVLLAGPPGVGKTLLARAVAAEAGVPFFAVSGAEFVESLVGVGAARVRDLFRRVRAVAPAIVFIDEVDAAGRRRGAGGATGGSDEREQTLNQLLVEMDGFAAGAGIVVMAATNRPDILDPALLRPGRFDRTVEVELPDVRARREILALHLGRRPHDPGAVDVEALAVATAGFSGADLANVVNEAALLAVREGSSVLAQSHLREAVLRVTAGTADGRPLAGAERHRIAVHEAGHAVVAGGLGRGAALQRVSVVARSHDLQRTVLDGDARLFTADDLHDAIAIAVAGAVAEEEHLGVRSTLAEDDLELATGLARDLVARYGLDDEVGMVRLLAPATGGHLGGRAALDELSPATHALLDAAVAGHLAQAAERARAVLRERAEDHRALVEALVEHEVVEGHELRRHVVGPGTPVTAG